MTANAMSGDREKALEAGMDDYVTKPIRSEKLEAAIQRWVSPADPDFEPRQAIPDAGGTRRPDSPKPPMRPREPLDRGIIANLRDLQDEDEPDLLEEIAGVFLTGAVSRLEALNEAVREDDAPSVEREAHALKGSSVNMGALLMARICDRLEHAGRSGDLTPAPELLHQLEEEFERVRPALEVEISSRHLG
jgi:HPt (histidine-containing phosphotransfer) domain-containing protein